MRSAFAAPSLALVVLAASLIACGGDEPASASRPTATATASVAASATAATSTPARTALATSTPTVEATTQPTAAPATPAPTQAPPPPVVTQPVATLPPAPPPPPAAPSAVSLDIVNFAFAPVAVAQGGAVTWTNRDPVAHDVVASNGVFKSVLLQAGESFTTRLDTPGSIAYICSVHPFMTGTVEVR